MQVMLRTHNAFGIELPVRSLFERPTIASLAERINVLNTVQNMVRLDDATADEEDEEW